jgi:hypothetical protein
MLALGCSDHNRSSAPDGDEVDRVPTTSTNGNTTSNDDTTSNDSNAGLVWRSANLTNFTSYPEPGSAECIDFNGCTWAGYFAGLDGQQSVEWVERTNIAAVHMDDFWQYNGKTLRVRDSDSQVDVVVYDACSDEDCNGCCSQNMSDTGFLIDLEINTAWRLGTEHGIVQWACVDC